MPSRDELPPPWAARARTWRILVVGVPPSARLPTCPSRLPVAQILSKLVADESSADNWDKDSCVIKDESKCPKAAMIKKNLDKLDKGECGITREEFHQFWFNRIFEDGKKEKANQKKASDWVRARRRAAGSHSTDLERAASPPSEMD